MNILWTIIIGFIAGVIAKFIMPGDNEPAGFILTTILGIVRAFVATFLGQALGWYGPVKARADWRRGWRHCRSACLWDDCRTSARRLTNLRARILPPTQPEPRRQSLSNGRVLVFQIFGNFAAVGGEFGHDLFVQPNVHAGRVIHVASVTEFLGKLLARAKARVRC